MQSVGTKNTGPEMIVRRLLHGMGFRYGLHRKDLPGRPDIVLTRHKKAIFVHGCYWHGHGCAKGRLPKTRLEYWGEKIEKNKARDRRNLSSLSGSGWDTLVLWQCQTKDPDLLQGLLNEFLNEKKANRN